MPPSFDPISRGRATFPHFPPAVAVKLDLDIRKTLTSATRTFTLSVQLQSAHERIVIVGPSGSGKSLTLQAIAGLITPDAGHIRLEGDTLYDASSQVCLPPQARRLAYVFQDYALFPHLTVYQNVAFSLSHGWRNPPCHPERSQWHPAVARWLDAFGLTSLASQYPADLSGGQRQRTALARALAATIQGTHSRIQFTPDLLPSDITGVTIYDQRSGQWEFHKGPVFASIVLADEINRASPKTQSALLEVMEESQITVDGKTHSTGRPFMVIATQNPIEQAGTYPLPEAQLDRFLMKTSVGYPERGAMAQVLADSANPDRSAKLSAVVSSAVVTQLADVAGTNYVDGAVLDYIAALAEATRLHQ